MASSSSPSPSESSSCNLIGTWTLVTRRRHRENPIRTHSLQPKTLVSKPDLPSPWIPSDSTDPERESKLLRRMHSSIRRLHNSRFARNFLIRLRDSQIQKRFNKLASHSPIEIVAYGIGSIESYETPRLQIALGLLLKQELGLISAKPIEVFDPVLSAVECAVLVSLGCVIISVDERCRREAAVPTIFYMPHCEAKLYDNLLDANWNPSMMNRMVLLGNSFNEYDRNVRERKGSCGSVKVEEDGKHLLRIRRFVQEIEISRGFKEEEEDEEEFYKAFHDISWHFFEIDDDSDIDILCK